MNTREPPPSLSPEDASGLVPSSFRILRQVLDRLERALNAASHAHFGAPCGYISGRAARSP